MTRPVRYHPRYVEQGRNCVRLAGIDAFQKCETEKRYRDNVMNRRLGRVGQPYQAQLFRSAHQQQQQQQQQPSPRH